MFSSVGSGPLIAMLWLAVILCCGFTALIALGIVPLVRVIKEQSAFITRTIEVNRKNEEPENFSEI